MNKYEGEITELENKGARAERREGEMRKTK